MSRFDQLIVLSMQQNQLRSPLLRSPPELRNQIFVYILGNRTWEIRPEHKVGLYTFYVPSKGHNRTKWCYNLALLRVSRQLYSETHLLPFNMGIFSAMNCVSLRFWLSKLYSFQRAAIFNIQLSCNFECIEDNQSRSPYDVVCAQRWAFTELNSLRHVQIIAGVLDVRGHLKRAVPASWIIEWEAALTAHVQSENPKAKVLLHRTYLPQRIVL